MLTTIQQELAAAWDAIAEWTIYVLMREGLENVALDPLARLPRAAEWIIRREIRSDEPRRRQIAAVLAGRLAEASGGSGRQAGEERVGSAGGTPVDPDLLAELFDLEARRIREVPREDTAAAQEGALEGAEVVSRIVDAAALWARVPELRDPAVEVLRRVLEAALAGEDWIGLERAAMVLARHGGPSDREVLTRLQRMLAASDEQAGAVVVARLLMGERSLIDEDETDLRYGDRAAAEFRIAGEARDSMDRLLEAAEEFEAA